MALALIWEYESKKQEPQNEHAPVVVGVIYSANRPANMSDSRVPLGIGLVSVSSSARSPSVLKSRVVITHYSNTSLTPASASQHFRTPYLSLFQ